MKSSREQKLTAKGGMKHAKPQFNHLVWNNGHFHPAIASLTGYKQDS